MGESHAQAPILKPEAVVRVSRAGDVEVAAAVAADVVSATAKLAQYSIRSIR